MTRSTLNYDTIEHSLHTLIESLSIDSEYTLDNKPKIVNLSSSSSDYTVYLPSASTMSGGFGFLFKKTNSSIYKITITADDNQTIDGFQSHDICNEYESLHLISDGSNWNVLDKNSNSIWSSVPPVYSRESDSTLTLSSAYPGIKIKTPLKYMIDGVDYYGICIATSDTSVSVAGAAITSTPTQLSVGTEDLVYDLPIFIPGAYGYAVADLIDSNLYAKIPWTLPMACLVSFGGYEKIADTGTSQPKINMKIGGNLVSDEGITMSTSWAYNSSTSINTDNYMVYPSETEPTLIEVVCTESGSSGNARDLTINTTWIFFKQRIIQPFTQTLTNNTEWIAPVGYYRYPALIECWGAGENGYKGGGGDGGSYAASEIALTERKIYSYQVGAYSLNEGDRDTIFDNTIIAAGGASSTSSIGEKTATGGSGVESQYGFIGIGGVSVGGGGGSSAGYHLSNLKHSALSGYNGSNSIGGSGSDQNGGNGGNGGATNITSGTNGTSPGGGGGGLTILDFLKTPGNGGNGQIIITYPSPGIL